MDEREQFDAWLEKAHREGRSCGLWSAWQARAALATIDALTTGAVAWIQHRDGQVFLDTLGECKRLEDLPHGTKFFLHPAPSPEAPAVDALTTAPEGWKLVPIEPTREMLEAAYGTHIDGFGLAYGVKNWQDMLAASPRANAAPALTDEERAFVELVRNRPGSKLNGGEAWSATGEPLWIRPEAQGLIEAIGSYKWRPLSKQAVDANGEKK
jgi:hypothetical protein